MFDLVTVRAKDFAFPDFIYYCLNRGPCADHVGDIKILFFVPGMVKNQSSKIRKPAFDANEFPFVIVEPSS